MSTSATPHAERLHIVLYGRTNSGKSSLINALTGQSVSLVSPIAGTTTDPVKKAIEIKGLGACVLIDTAGYDDTDEQLGALRIERTRATISQADIAVLVISCEDIDLEEQWIGDLKGAKVPIVTVLNKGDITTYPDTLKERLKALTGHPPIEASACTHVGIDAVRKALHEAHIKDDERTITGDLVSAGDTVLLVMPQDAAAPKGRLILPQVQTIRELLDKGAVPICCTPETMPQALSELKSPPHLIITDSQAFKEVYPLKPERSLLTSFSVLLAAYKGDIANFVHGAKAIDALTPSSRVLIAEACTHAPESEDIGTVKIPRLLRQRIGAELQIDMVSGKDFPHDLTPYDLVIHCGACMFTRKMVMSRSAQAQAQQVPMTNYGITLAYLTGILDKVSLPSKP